MIWPRPNTLDPGGPPCTEETDSPSFRNMRISVPERHKMCKTHTDLSNSGSLSQSCLFLAKSAVAVRCTVTATVVGRVPGLRAGLPGRIDENWKELLISQWEDRSLRVSRLFNLEAQDVNTHLKAKIPLT